MKKSFLFSIMSIIVVFVMIIGCEKETVTPKVNSNIIRIMTCNTGSVWDCGNYSYGIWEKDNTIYCACGLRKVVINENFEKLFIYNYQQHYYADTPLKSTVFPFLSMHLTSNESSILSTHTIYSDVSIGGMFEFNVNTTDTIKLLEKSYNIGAANYFRDDNHIIYYSYGKPYGTNAGYYLFDKTSKKSELIFRHLSEIAELEILNGFDIHPTQNKLLIPVVYKSKSPIILEYDMDSHKTDTLNVTFDLKEYRVCLWLRYNKTGNQILYCSYPRGVLTDFVPVDTEIGILDRNTLSKRVLDANPDKNAKAVSIFPSWSPDDKHILFSSSSLYDKSVGLYSLYILKNVNP